MRIDELFRTLVHVFQVAVHIAHSPFGGFCFYNRCIQFCMMVSINKHPGYQNQYMLIVRT